MVERKKPPTVLSFRSSATDLPLPSWPETGQGQAWGPGGESIRAVRSRLSDAPVLAPDARRYSVTCTMTNNLLVWVPVTVAVTVVMPGAGVSG